jgi:hypothetical protein
MEYSYCIAHILDDKRACLSEAPLPAALGPYLMLGKLAGRVFVVSVEQREIVDH